MNGEDLLYDYQHFVVDKATKWAFIWNYAEAGTARPIPRLHHATMYLVMNEDDPIFAVGVFFAAAERDFKYIKFNMMAPDRNDREGNYFSFTVSSKRTKDVLLIGEMRTPTGKFIDPNVGNFATFHCTTSEGLSLVKKLVQGALIFGMLAYIPHTREEEDTGDGYRVVSVTGMGEDKKGLATRFQLFHEQEEVARCHLTYRDGSWDPSMGPTVEMIAVKQSRRGEGLAKVLWYHVRRYIEKNFTIECLNHDTEPGYIMIKATQVGTNEVEIRKETDGSLHPMGFKEFLYDYCGFSVRVQKGAAAYLMGSGRPKDEEAVLFIPLLRPGQASPMKKPKPGQAVYRETLGKRMCFWCNKVAVDMKRCASCGIAFYCQRSEQVADWKKRHKLWCGKSREEIEQTLIDRGDLIIGPDGDLIICVNRPGRTFTGFGGGAPAI